MFAEQLAKAMKRKHLNQDQLAKKERFRHSGRPASPDMVYVI